MFELRVLNDPLYRRQRNVLPFVTGNIIPYQVYHHSAYVYSNKNNSSHMNVSILFASMMQREQSN